jgi:type II secretory pathway pseudopilin PulG
VEILVDFVVIAIVATAIVSAFAAAQKSVQLSKTKISAVALANEKMEDIRNQSYDSLATAHGTIYPPGQILDDETVTEDNIKYNVHTVISYVDDPFDGNFAGTIAGKPKDIYPYDYKKAEITIYKVGRVDPLAVLTTNISAKAAETPTNTGILYFCVINSVNQPVPDTIVTLQNTTMNPPVDMQFTTDSSGCTMVPGLPPDSHNDYHAVVSKDGYSTDMTYPRTSQNPNELQPDIDIMAQQVTNLTLAIDKVSTLKVHTVDLTGVAIPNINLHIDGTKEKYFNPVTYKYSQDQQTDGSGNLVLSKMEWDDYKFELLSAGKYISTISPVQPVNLDPDSSLDVTLYLTISSSAPRIQSVTPAQGVKGDVATVTIAGVNFAANPIVKLKNATKEIIGTNISVKQGKTIDVDFNLASGDTGIYDIYIENPGGEFANQPGVFSIVNP